MIFCISIFVCIINNLLVHILFNYLFVNCRKKLLINQSFLHMCFNLCIEYIKN